MSRDGAFSCAQQTKNWCVGFSFPPPAYAGIHPTLYLFGFRANALNSHSPLLCLALIDHAFWDLFGALFGDDLQGVRGSRAASGGLQGPPGPPGVSEASRTLIVGFVFFFAAAGPAASAALQGLRGPPVASGGLGGLRGLRALGAFTVEDVGFGVGFASFLGCQPCSCLADPELSAFPGCLGRPAHWLPERRREAPEGQGRQV